MNDIIFFKSTEKLYNQIRNQKKRNGLKGYPHPTQLDIEIQSSEFEQSEWKFLVDNEANFYFHIEINGTFVKFPVYKIENDTLKSNEINVLGIQSKYNRNK